MAFIYLIGQSDTDNTYKIGLTKAKDINKRIKELQTGNSEPLYLKTYYKTDTPYKLEKMLHNYYKENNTLNEWFVFDSDIEADFLEQCEKYQKIINSLENNPFFKNN